MPLPADAHASLLALMSKWKGAHILSVEQFDEPMLLELLGSCVLLCTSFRQESELRLEFEPTPLGDQQRYLWTNNPAVVPTPMYY